MTTLRPPFKAPDMKALYKKVVAVEYPPISSKYSADLSGILKVMLQANPLIRPSCEQILQMSTVTKNIKDPIIFENIRRSFDALPKGSDDGLLGTIKVPRALNQLKEKLPKPNYKRQQSQPTRMAGNSIVTGDHSNPVTPKHQVKLTNDLANRPISSKGAPQSNLQK